MPLKRFKSELKKFLRNDLEEFYDHEKYFIKNLYVCFLTNKQFC